MQVIYENGIVTNVQFENGEIPIPIDLDFQQPNYVVVPSNQYEDKIKYIVADLYDNGSQYVVPSGTTAKFCATKPDGKGLFNECIVFGNQIIYGITLQTTACHGNFGAEFRLYGMNGTVGNPLTFKMNIAKSALQDGTVISSNEFNALTDVIKEIDISKTNVETATVNAIRATDNAIAKVTEINEETLIIWKPYVATYTAITSTYPSPVLGWTTQAKDTGIRWRYNGIEWVNIGIDTTDKVGDLTQLPTTDKTNTVNAIKEVESDLAAITTITDTDNKKYSFKLQKSATGIMQINYTEVV